MKLHLSFLLVTLASVLATRVPGQQASRSKQIEGTYVLDTTGLAPLPFFRPGLISGEGTTLRSAGFTLESGSRFLGEIVAVYTDSGPLEDNLGHSVCGSRDRVWDHDAEALASRCHPVSPRRSAAFPAVPMTVAA